MRPFQVVYRKPKGGVYPLAGCCRKRKASMASVPVANSFQTDRRSVRRWLVDCPASLRTTAGTHHGRLTDLSEKGARFEGPGLPPEGADAMLDWGLNEVFCRIAWRKDGACGVYFEQPIPTYLVEETAHGVEESSMPVAQCGNIPLGQKRARLGTSSTD
ncbi:PilZ domain-containing protein [Erythrobacter mangrovi]|nr:PilZ domain-containing protein [Erythrobacter mangrovi]